MLRIIVPCKTLDECYKLKDVLNSYVQNSECCQNGDIDVFTEDQCLYFDIGMTDESTYGTYTTKPNWALNSIDEEFATDKVLYPPIDRLGWVELYNRLSMVNLCTEAEQLLKLVENGEVHRNNAWYKVDALIEVVYNKLAHDTLGVFNSDIVLRDVRILEDYLQQIQDREY